MKKLSKKLTAKLEKMGIAISYYEEEGSVEFRAFSPAGQDFFFEVDRGATLSDLAENIYSYYEGYDPSEEAYMWLDGNGHGINGAPYEMGDVYADMIACEEIIRNIYIAVNNAA